MFHYFYWTAKGSFKVHQQSSFPLQEAVIKNLSVQNFPSQVNKRYISPRGALTYQCFQTGAVVIELV